MFDKLKVKNPIYPFICILSSIMILIFGLSYANNIKTLYFFGFLTVLFLLFGYYKQVLLTIPFVLVACLIFGVIAYFSHNKNIYFTIPAVNRILAFFMAVIPNLGITPIDFTRSLKNIKISKKIILGFMIVFGFFPLLKKEQRQIKQAMKTRGASSFFNFKIFYRAYLIPLMIRIVNISETLSMSIELKGFSLDKTKTSQYKRIDYKLRDFIYLILISTSMIGAIIWMQY